MNEIDTAPIIEGLKKLQKSGDAERAHVEADNILIDLLEKLGYSDVAEEWGEVPKRYA